MKMMKKSVLIEALRAMDGVAFNENASYPVLYKLWKENQEVPTSDAEKRLDLIKVQHPDLYERARHKAHLSDSQIAIYPDVESLKAFCDRVHPASNPDALPKQGVRPEPVVYEKGMPDKIEFESKFERKPFATNRPQFDEQTLQTELRKINRKYDIHDPVRVTFDRSYDPVKGMTKDNRSVKFLITKIVVYFKKGQ